MNEFQLFLFTYPMFQLFFLKNKPFLVKNFYLNFAKKGKCIVNASVENFLRYISETCAS